MKKKLLGFIGILMKLAILLQLQDFYFYFDDDGIRLDLFSFFFLRFGFPSNPFFNYDPTLTFSLHFTTIILVPARTFDLLFGKTLTSFYFFLKLFICSYRILAMV